MIAPINIRAKQKWECAGLPDLEETLRRRRRSDVSEFCKLNGIDSERSADEAMERLAKEYSISNGFVEKVYQEVEVLCQRALAEIVETAPTEVTDPSTELPEEEEILPKTRKKKIG